MNELTTKQLRELERAACIQGDTKTAELLARIIDLEDQDDNIRVGFGDE